MPVSLLRIASGVELRFVRLPEPPTARGTCHAMGGRLVTPFREMSRRGHRSKDGLCKDPKEPRKASLGLENPSDGESEVSSAAVKVNGRFASLEVRASDFLNHPSSRLSAVGAHPRVDGGTSKVGSKVEGGAYNPLGMQLLPL